MSNTFTCWVIIPFKWQHIFTPGNTANHYSLIRPARWSLPRKYSKKRSIKGNCITKRHGVEKHYQRSHFKHLSALYGQLLDRFNSFFTTGSILFFLTPFLLKSFVRGKYLERQQPLWSSGDNRKQRRRLYVWKGQMGSKSLPSAEFVRGINRNGIRPQRKCTCLLG